MSSKRYPEEFKLEAVKQISERGHAVADVASRIGVSQLSFLGSVCYIFSITKPSEAAFMTSLTTICDESIIELESVVKLAD